MGLAAQPLTAAPHVLELPTAAAKTSWREWFATGDQRVSGEDRIAFLDRAPTRFDPDSDHGHGVQRPHIPCMKRVYRNKKNVVPRFDSQKKTRSSSR